VAADKNEILFSRFHVNYNNEPDIYKKGSVIFRDVRLWPSFSFIIPTFISNSTSPLNLVQPQAQPLRKSMKRHQIHLFQKHRQRRKRREGKKQESQFSTPISSGTIFGREGHGYYQTSLERSPKSLESVLYSETPRQ
jgi:hypothetical protein